MEKENVNIKHLKYKVVTETYKLKRKWLIKNIPENNSLIIKKHNQRKLHKLNVEEMIKAGYYKNPEFD